jgi:hypothetical protein
MIEGEASIANKSEGNIQVKQAYKKLITKYIQYQKVRVGEMCIIITPKKLTSWSNS